MKVGDIVQYASLFEYETDALTGIIIQENPLNDFKGRSVNFDYYYHFLSFCGWSDWIPENELFPLTIS